MENIALFIINTIAFPWMGWIVQMKQLILDN
jgi:hypothetical protein